MYSHGLEIENHMTQTCSLNFRNCFLCHGHLIDLPETKKRKIISDNYTLLVHKLYNQIYLLRIKSKAFSWCSSTSPSCSLNSFRSEKRKKHDVKIVCHFMIQYYQSDWFSTGWKETAFVTTTKKRNQIN